MTLGKRWRKEIGKESEKEILFEFLEKEVEEAIEDKAQYIWISRGKYNGILMKEDYLREFAKINDLRLETVKKAGWRLYPQ